MLQNSAERLNIWLQLQNPFDYNAFSELCKEQNIVPLSQLDFAQKVGMLLAARHTYPDLDIKEAYIMYVQEASGVTVGSQPKILSITPVGNTLFQETNESNDLITQARQGCCGGGQIK